MSLKSKLSSKISSDENLIMVKHEKFREMKTLQFSFSRFYFPVYIFHELRSLEIKLYFHSKHQQISLPAMLVATNRANLNIHHVTGDENAVVWASGEYSSFPDERTRNLAGRKLSCKARSNTTQMILNVSLFLDS